jgi:hypothetical protein
VNSYRPCLALLLTDGIYSLEKRKDGKFGSPNYVPLKNSVLSNSHSTSNDKNEKKGFRLKNGNLMIELCADDPALISQWMTSVSNQIEAIRQKEGKGENPRVKRSNTATILKETFELGGSVRIRKRDPMPKIVEDDVVRKKKKKKKKETFFGLRRSPPS